MFCEHSTTRHGFLYLANGKMHPISEGNGNGKCTLSNFEVLLGDSLALHSHRSIDGPAMQAKEITGDDRLFNPITLASKIEPQQNPIQLLARLELLLDEAVEVSDESRRLICGTVLSTWFSHLSPTAVYLWILGPPESGKTTLLRFLSAVCRNSILVGDLTAASVYKLIGEFKPAPTLLIDEADFRTSQGSSGIRRLLRTGNVPGIPAVRNGHPFDVFGPKIIASCRYPDDPALASRAVFVKMAPSRRGFRTIDDAWLNRVAQELKPQLLAYFLSNHDRAGTSHNFSRAVDPLPSRLRDTANALAIPLLGNLELEQNLIKVLEQQAEENRLRRCEQPEYIVAEELFAASHAVADSDSLQRPVRGMFLGNMAANINERLEIRGDRRKFSARGIGAILDLLDIPRRKVGRLGIAVQFTPSVLRKIHRWACYYAISRRDIAPCDRGTPTYGGVPCELCTEFDTTGGLKFLRLPKPKRPASLKGRPSLLSESMRDKDPIDDSTIPNTHDFKEMAERR